MRARIHTEQCIDIISTCTIFEFIAVCVLYDMYDDRNSCTRPSTIWGDESVERATPFFAIENWSGNRLHVCLFY